MLENGLESAKNGIILVTKPTSKTSEEIKDCEISYGGEIDLSEILDGRISEHHSILFLSSIKVNTGIIQIIKLDII